MTCTDLIQSPDTGRRLMDWSNRCSNWKVP